MGYHTIISTIRTILVKFQLNHSISETKHFWLIILMMCYHDTTLSLSKNKFSRIFKLMLSFSPNRSLTKMNLKFKSNMKNKHWDICFYNMLNLFCSLSLYFNRLIIFSLKMRLILLEICKYCKYQNQSNLLVK